MMTEAGQEIQKSKKFNNSHGIRIDWREKYYLFMISIYILSLKWHSYIIP